MTGAIVHCEIRVSDKERAKKFYSSVFEWVINPIGDGTYWLVSTARAVYSEGVESGMDAVIRLREGSAPPTGQSTNAFICNIEVGDVDEALKRVAAAGGKVIRDKQPLEGVGFEAFCEDTEGNVFSLMHDEGLLQLREPSKR